MRIELPIINEPEAGLCTAADLTGNGQTSKILISTGCCNNYISEDLYSRLEHEDLTPPYEIRENGAAYYINDLTSAKAGVIKFLRLPGHTLPDIPVVVTSSYPAYQCDMVLSVLTISACKQFAVDPEKGIVTITDKQP
jgi:hypothetical protein